jgi:hypothetical protein
MSFQSKEWILADASGSDGLKARIVSTPPLGSFDVLVKMKALSLNHRDVVLASVWLFFSTFHPKKEFFFFLTYFLGIVSSTLDQRCRCGVRRSRGSYPSWGSSHRVQKRGSCCNDVLPRPCRWSSDPYSGRKCSRILEKWSIQTVCCFPRSWTCACSGKFNLARSFLAYLCGSDCLECSFRGEKNQCLQKPRLAFAWPFYRPGRSKSWARQGQAD